MTVSLGREGIGEQLVVWPGLWCVCSCVTASTCCVAGVCDQQVVALSNIQGGGGGRCLWKEGTETVSHKLHSVVCSHYWSLPRAALHYPSLFTQTVETILAMAKGK